MYERVGMGVNCQPMQNTTFKRVLRPSIENAEKGNDNALCICSKFVFLGFASTVFTQRIRKKQYTFQVVCNVIRTVT